MQWLPQTNRGAPVLEMPAGVMNFTKIINEIYLKIILDIK